ncbi:MAG: hypothetical protein E6K76_09625 [Candidatus Eisenbacteria bacterium]|uniref:Uncharacterized protein n=1 Tax=Eiseniibacteriota bacterium TaxID=2212470 RepID=A0A538T2D2_UNCEI|nr:MAG: hypothetical protein E6K76_09625 [Candidatus Eisenbacteria bacterium]
MSETSALAHRVLSSSVARLVAAGARKIMITSSAAGEGKSTIAAELGRNLAQSGRMGIALVDADTIRPTLHRLFHMDNRRGLGELLGEVYHMDLSRENPDQFGVGDWIELIRAQSKTGKLQISEDGEEFSVIFNKGLVSSLSDRRGELDGLLGEILVRQGRISEEQRDAALRVKEEGSHPLGGVLRGLGYLETGELDAALELQLKNRLHRILTLRQPRYSFAETVEAYLPASSGRLLAKADGTGIDRFVLGMVGDYLKHPYLSSQVPSYLKDTPIENLKVLTCGGPAFDLRDSYFSVPFTMVIDRLAKSYDVVLIDSAPVAFDSPTGSLAPTVDGVLLVVGADGLQVSVIQKAKEQLQRSGANLLGVVLNRVDLLKDEAAHYYHSAYR